MHPLRWRPFLCPAGHDLTGKGKVLVGWTPCTCGPAWANHGGHRTYRCLACEEDGWRTICYLPEHLSASQPSE